MSNANTIRPGTYFAKIREYYVDKTYNGSPRINITFDVKTDSTNPNVTQRSQWSGSLSSPKSRDLVLKTLAICGLSSPSMLGAIAKGRAGGVLNVDDDLLVEIVTEERETKSIPPTKYLWTFIKYINPSDGIAGKDIMAYDDFDSFVNNTGLADDFARLKDSRQHQEGAQEYSEANPPPPEDPIIPF